MKALGVRMRNILAITLVIIASGVSALDRRGMFVCTPMSSDEKPILYAFDGKHLIRDNNSEVPFTKLSSLADNLDLYFAFEPTFLGKRKIPMQSLLQSDRELITSEFEEFTKWCAFDVYMKDKTIETFYKLDKYIEKSKLQPIQNLIKEYKDTECESVNIYGEDVLTPVTEEDFNQVKLTINFEKMWVIEERLNKGGSDLGNSAFEIKRNAAKKYQCKSLGIDVPDVDTSKSIVPLASNI